jgi:hypothetical protein
MSIFRESHRHTSSTAGIIEKGAPAVESQLDELAADAALRHGLPECTDMAGAAGVRVGLLIAGEEFILII